MERYATTQELLWSAGEVILALKIALQLVPPDTSEELVEVELAREMASRALNLMDQIERAVWRAEKLSNQNEAT